MGLSEKYINYLIIWSLMVCVLVVGNAYDNWRNMNVSVQERARDLCNVMLARKLWARANGGIYIGAPESMPWNEQAHAKNGVVVTTDGKRLMKVGPSVMVRGVSKSLGSDSLRFKVTSLTPASVESQPDEWEVQALKGFARGEGEVLESFVGGEEEYYRFMMPLRIKKECFQCHYEEQRKVGELRGGISVTLPAEGVMGSYVRHMYHVLGVYLIGYILGVAAIFGLARYSHRAKTGVRQEQRKFQRLVEFTGAIHWESDLKAKSFAYISPQVDEMFGYPASSWKQEGFLESIVHPDDRAWVIEYSQKRIATGQDHVLSYRIIAADGHPRWVRAVVNIEKDKAGAAVGIHGMFIDDTDLKKTESRLMDSLMEKEVLLKEVHHRVRNNMAIISSLQSLQSNYVTDEKAKGLFRESERRIRAMALVHEKLYQSKDLAHIEVGDYIRMVLDDLHRSFHNPLKSVDFEMKTDGVYLDVGILIPLGLILTELVTNAIKYAFVDLSAGEIYVSLKCLGAGEMELIVRDNGRGMPEDIELQKARTLGFRMVNALVDQMDGTVEVDGSAGTSFMIRFKTTGGVK